MAILVGIRFIVASLVCLLALILPYSLRLYWFKFVSFFVHMPFRAFGSISRWMLKELGVDNPYE